MNFTKTELERFKCPENKATVVLTDPRQHGLQLYVGRQKKTWYVVYYFHKKPRREKLGYFPELSIDEARMRANEIAILVRRGKDPARKHDMTLKQALEFTIEKRIADGKLSPTTADQYRATMRLYASDWDNRDISEITVDEIDHRKHHLAIKKGHKAAANQFVAVMSIIWRTKRLPRLDVTRYSLPPRKSLVDDWAKWYQFVTGQPKAKKNALLFALFTGLRSMNARSIKWSQIHLDKKTIHIEKTKTTRDVTLPLNDLAVAVLTDQKGDDDEFVFPAGRSKSGHIEVLRLDDFKARVHDTRRLFDQAGRRALLPDYAIAALRADVGKNMRDMYDGEQPPHEWTDRVADQIKITLGIAA